jgi:hypothetical protein
MQSLLEKGYELVSGGTENHLVLVNLRNKVKGNIPSFGSSYVVIFLFLAGSFIRTILRFFCMLDKLF